MRASGRVAACGRAHGVALAFAITLGFGVGVITVQAQPGTPRGDVGAASPRVLTPPAGSRVKAGFVVRPDTVEVGDPFTLVVTVVVPDGAQIEWPTIDDTTAVVVMRAPTAVSNESLRAGGRTERAEYALAAWNVGVLPIGLSDAKVRYGTTTLNVPLAAARIAVKSVLPGDTTLHVPKPARPLFQRVVPWWKQWWPALLVLAALGVLWWLFRRRAQRHAGVAAAGLDAYGRALHDFARLERLALADSGERGRAVALAIDVLRSYLMARLPGAALSRTTAELLAAIGDDPRIPHDRLLSLLTDGDGVKFARHVVSATRARELAAESRAMVEHIEAADRACRVAAAAALDAAADAERLARSADEEEARRNSRRQKAGAA
jgi:hypothetical protein